MNKLPGTVLVRIRRQHITRDDDSASRIHSH